MKAMVNWMAGSYFSQSISSATQTEHVANRLDTTPLGAVLDSIMHL